MKRISPRILIATLGLMSVSVGLAVHAANRSDDESRSNEIPVVNPSQMDYNPFANREPAAQAQSPAAPAPDIESLPPVSDAAPRPTELRIPAWLGRPAFQRAAGGEREQAQTTEPARNREPTLRDPSQFIPAGQHNRDGVVRFPSVTPAVRPNSNPLQPAAKPPVPASAVDSGSSFARLPATDTSRRRADSTLPSMSASGSQLGEASPLPQPVNAAPATDSSLAESATETTLQPAASKPLDLIPFPAVESDEIAENSPPAQEPHSLVAAEPIPTNTDTSSDDSAAIDADQTTLANHSDLQQPNQAVPAIDVRLTSGEIDRQSTPTVVPASGIKERQDPFSLAALDVRQGTRPQIDQVGRVASETEGRRTGTLYRRFQRIPPASHVASADHIETANRAGIEQTGTERAGTQRPGASRTNAVGVQDRVIAADPVPVVESQVASRTRSKVLEIAPPAEARNASNVPPVHSREELIALMAQPAVVAELDSDSMNSPTDLVQGANDSRSNSGNSHLPAVTAASVPAQPAVTGEPVERVAVPYQSLPSSATSDSVARSTSMQLTGPDTDIRSQDIRPDSRIPEFASRPVQSPTANPAHPIPAAATHEAAIAQANLAESASQIANPVQFQDSPSDRRVGQAVVPTPHSSFAPEIEYGAPISNQEGYVPTPEDPLPSLPSAEEMAGNPLEEEVLSDPFIPGGACGGNCGQKYYWTADLIAYQPSLPSVQISNAVVTDGGEFREGGRIRFGYRGDCLVGWEATLTQLSHATEIDSSSTSGLAGTLTTRWVPTGGFTGASLSSFNSPTAQIHLQKHRFEYTDFEFNRMTWGWDVLNTQFGLRVTKFRENLFFGSGPSNLAIENMPGQFRQDISNTLIGPQVGMTLIDDSRRSITFDMRGKAGVYVNFLDKDTIYANNGQILLNATNTQDVKFAVSGEFGTGLSWHLSPNWKIRAGFDALYWYGIGTIRDQQLTAPAPNFGGLLLTGGMGSLINNEDDILLWGGTIGLYGNWP